VIHTANTHVPVFTSADKDHSLISFDAMECAAIPAELNWYVACHQMFDRDRRPCPCLAD
jgi:hypothetical protein